MRGDSIMRRLLKPVQCMMAAMLLTAWLPTSVEAKSYSSRGGRSYSSSRSSGSSSSMSRSRSSSSSSSARRSSGFDSSSSRRSSGGGFTSGSGRSYSSGSRSTAENRKSYTSGKSYTAGSGQRAEPDSPSFTFDSPAARARREESSRKAFTDYQESMRPRTTTPGATEPGSRPGSTVPPPLGDTRTGRRDYGPGGGTFPSSGDGWTSRRGYYPDQRTIQTRPWRSYETFAPYWSRPRIGFGDPYNALFWWWLLDRSLDERALWAYHHRDTMDPSRYQALVSTNKELQQRIEQLEAQQVKRDTNYTPANLDRD